MNVFFLQNTSEKFLSKNIRKLKEYAVILIHISIHSAGISKTNRCPLLLVGRFSLLTTFSSIWIDTNIKIQGTIARSDYPLYACLQNIVTTFAKRPWKKVQTVEIKLDCNFCCLNSLSDWIQKNMTDLTFLNTSQT